jgi:hypothetical protein
MENHENERFLDLSQEDREKWLKMENDERGSNNDEKDQVDEKIEKKSFLDLFREKWKSVENMRNDEKRSSYDRKGQRG